MDFELSKEQMLLKNSARDFLKKESPATMVREMKNDQKGYSTELWSKMVDLGWTGLNIPEKYGGIGGSFLDLVILLEEMGEVLLPGPFFSTVVVGGSLILAAGTEEMKETLLPGIVDGELHVGLAKDEPGGRYDNSVIDTCATPLENGYSINGTKIFVENAQISNRLLCLARISDGGSASQGGSLFLVNSKNDGLGYTPLKTIGYDKQYEVVFNDVKVSEKDLMSGRGKGAEILAPIMEMAACAKSAEILGGMSAVHNMSLKYAKERVQFGKPIGSYQAIQYHLVEMAMGIEAAKVLTYHAAWKISQGLSAKKEIAMAKAWTGEASQRVASLGHQIHGGYGFCEETDMHLYYRRCKTGELAYGDSDYHLEKVAQEIGM